MNEHKGEDQSVLVTFSSKLLLVTIQGEIRSNWVIPIPDIRKYELTILINIINAWVIFRTYRSTNSPNPGGDIKLLVRTKRKRNECG